MEHGLVKYADEYEKDLEVIMKIIVDEMPSESKGCIFSECTSQLHGSYVCKLWQGRGCEPYRCDLLKPITDYVTEERIAENVTKRTSLAERGKVNYENN